MYTFAIPLFQIAARYVSTSKYTPKLWMNILIKPENNLHKLSLSSFAWLGLTQVSDSSNCKYKRSKQWIRLSVFFVFFPYNHAKHCLILATFSAISQIHDSPRAFLVRYNP